MVLDYQYYQALRCFAYKDSEIGTLTKRIDPDWLRENPYFPPNPREYSFLKLASDRGLRQPNKEESSALDLRTLPVSAMLMGFEQHRHARHLPAHIDFAGELEQEGLLMRGWMRLNEYVLTHLRTPTAQIPVAVLKKINGPVVFICPSAGIDFSPGLVDRHE